MIDAKMTTRGIFAGCFNEALLSLNTTRVNRRQLGSRVYQVSGKAALVQNVAEELATEAFNDMLQRVGAPDARSICFNDYNDTVNIWRQRLHIRRSR